MTRKGSIAWGQTQIRVNDDPKSVNLTRNMTQSWVNLTPLLVYIVCRKLTGHLWPGTEWTLFHVTLTRVFLEGIIMDLLQMDIHRRVNEFMHLSLSKVSQKHFRHAFPLWSAWSSPPVSRRNMNIIIEIWKLHAQKLINHLIKPWKSMCSCIVYNWRMVLTHSYVPNPCCLEKRAQVLANRLSSSITILQFFSIIF